MDTLMINLDKNLDNVVISAPLGALAANDEFCCR
jgi:hypothetical protein